MLSVSGVSELLTSSIVNWINQKPWCAVIYSVSFACQCILTKLIVEVTVIFTLHLWCAKYVQYVTYSLFSWVLSSFGWVGVVFVVSFTSPCSLTVEGSYDDTCRVSLKCSVISWFFEHRHYAWKATFFYEIFVQYWDKFCRCCITFVTVWPRQ